MSRKRLLITAAGALLAIAIAGGVAYATIPGPGNVYNACMLKGLGTIRLIDKSLPSTNLMSHCTDKETEISWNQAGQPGPAGPAGAKGEPGAPGKDGANGTNGVSVTTASEPAGANCAGGGVQLTALNGLTYVCNGKDGADGQDGVDGQDGTNGANGADGTNGVGVTSAVEPLGSNCPGGGSKFTAANGVTYACNGAPGRDGTNGTNGAPGPAGPEGPAGTTGQDATTVFGTAGLSLTTTSLTNLPGLSQTIDVPANAKVYVSADGGFLPNSGVNGAATVVDVGLRIDGAIVPNAGFRRGTAENRAVTNALIGIENWAFSFSGALSAGQHTIAVVAALSPAGGTAFSATTATISGDGTSVLQGQLTVVIVKR